MMLSHRLSGQKGALTRILSCTHEDLAKVPKEELELLPTHVTPSYTHHPRTGDVYSAYNKPVAVIDWLARTDVKEEYVLIIDADMIMLSPFVPEVVGAARGWAVSAYFAYMKGVNNELALKHVPEVVPRNDTLAGPRGRRGDMVGGFTLMHRDDLRRVAPLWLKYTEDVRFDPDAWTLSGDHYSIHKGDKPWISEMYGYSYACSKADVWHKVDHTAMLYPGYAVAGGWVLSGFGTERGRCPSAGLRSCVLVLGVGEGARRGRGWGGAQRAGGGGWGVVQWGGQACVASRNRGRRATSPPPTFLRLGARLSPPGDPLSRMLQCFQRCCTTGSNGRWHKRTGPLTSTGTLTSSCSSARRGIFRE